MSSAETDKKSIGTSMGTSFACDELPLPASTHANAPPPPIVASAQPQQLGSDVTDPGPLSKLLPALLDGSQIQRSKLGQRLASLRSLRELWEAGDIRKVLLNLRQIDDTSVAADLFRSGILQSSSLDLEGASLALLALGPLFASMEEVTQLVAINAAASLLSNFGPLIHRNRSSVPDAVGVDLSAEARQQRCQACFAHFVEIRRSLDGLTATGTIAAAADKLRSQMHAILQI